MTVGPRIVFVRFLSSDSPKLTPWRTHAARVLGQAVSETAQQSGDDESRLVWQLVSGNNRQLARSVGVFSSFEAATVEVQTVVDAGDNLDVHLTSEAGRGVYGWYANVAGQPVITCARWYFTDRDRRQAVDLALRSVPHAILHVGARLTDPALLGGSNVR